MSASIRTLTRSALTALALLGTSAIAAPATSPCVNPGVRDGARRTLHEASATATALAFCTGEDCWSLDLASSAFKSIPAIKPSAPPSDTPGKSADGRASATPTEVTFCPSAPTSCKKFSYKFAFQPQGGLHPMLNAAGTLGAVIYAGVGEEGEPRYLLTYDLAAGKLLKQIEFKTGNADVFRTSFLYNNALYSAKGKRLGKLAMVTTDLVPLTGTDLVAMADPEHGTVVIQDTATGKARGALKLGVQGIDQLVSSADGATLYVLAQGATEGEVVAIDVAKNKLASRMAPPRCAAGTTRAR